MEERPGNGYDWHGQRVSRLCRRRFIEDTNRSLIEREVVLRKEQHMSRVAIFFLVVITLGLAILLAWLGLTTVKSNLVGWFLLITGLTYFFGVIIVYWVRGIRFWKPQATGEVIEEERDDRSFWAIVLGMVSAFYLPPLEYLYFSTTLSRSNWMEWMGLLLISTGSVLFIWARRVLGKYYAGHVSLLEGQPLVQSGPYRSIRHPAYTGYLLMTFGLVIGYSSITGLAAILGLLLPGLVYRINVEEKMLVEHFGAQFKEYAGGTARLIPHIW